MIQLILLMVATAVLTSALTLAVAWYVLQPIIAKEVDQRLLALHDDISRTLEIKVKRAVVESLAEIDTVDVLRDTTWKAAKTGTEILSDSLSSLWGKKTKRGSDV